MAGGSKPKRPTSNTPNAWGYRGGVQAPERLDVTYVSLTDVCDPQGQAPVPSQSKLADGGGMHLLTHATPGGKLWRLKLPDRWGAEKLLAIGAYPEIGFGRGAPPP